MIIDKLENSAAYMALSPGIALALQALQSGELDNRELGRYELDGTNVYAMVQEYQTKAWSSGKLEVHRKYIDVQYVAEGAEKMGYTPASALPEFDPYNEEKDVAFHAGIGELVSVTRGMIAIFFPHDAHAPTLGMTATGGDTVKKIVIKVAV